MSISATPQTRWAWLEIDLAALRKNVRNIRKLLSPSTALMCVVKADAYGHGAAHCAKSMVSAGADQFGVATVDEGIALRQSGFTQPILILSEPPVDAVQYLVDFDLMPAVFTSDFALAYGEAAASAGKEGRYHLAVETGMNRTGIAHTDVVEFRQSVDFHRGLVCAGTFTHFATAESSDGWDFALQKNRFDTAIAALRDAGFDPGLVHCDNSSGTIVHPEAHYDMVRAGIVLYGLHPDRITRPRIDLIPVMSVHARVTRTIYPQVGDGVSYGFTYRLPKQSIQIATIPLGYGDGLSRTLSNRVEFLSAGMRHRQVGNICMDQCMFAVDVNPVRGYKPANPVNVGDEVIVMGRDGDEEISADELAEMLGTINYEVCCSFGLRLEKVYV